MEKTSHFGNSEFDRIVTEIIADDIVREELSRHPWLEAAVGQWCKKMQGFSEEAGIYSPVKEMTAGSRQHLMVYLKANLLCELQMKQYKKARLAEEKARLVLNEYLEMVEDHNLEKEEVVPGGLFSGRLDMDTYLPLLQELVEYSLAMAGLLDYVRSMDRMAEYVNTPLVRDYITDLQSCLFSNPNETLQHMQAAMECSKVANEMALDASKPKPVKRFAEMISMLSKSNGSDNLNGILTNK